MGKVEREGEEQKKEVLRRLGWVLKECESHDRAKAEEIQTRHRHQLLYQVQERWKLDKVLIKQKEIMVQKAVEKGKQKQKKAELKAKEEREMILLWERVRRNTEMQQEKPHAQK